MNSYNLNNPIQNQRQQYPNYIPGISNQDMIQGKSKQEIPSNESNKNKQNLNQNIIKSENNLTQNINELTHKNSIVQTKRENEVLCGGHLGVPTKLMMNAMKSICKISYDHDNKQKFGNGFFLKFSDSLKLLITN